MGKLKERWYPVHSCRKILDRYPWSSKHLVAVPKAPSEKAAFVVPFKLTYCVGAVGLGITQVIRDHEYLLTADARYNLKIVACFRTSPNLFRARYDRFR